MTRKYRSLALLGMTLLPALASAQTVRGVTTESGIRASVPGVVVLLVDARGGVVARALTNEHGEFTMRASTPGAYRLRTMRIGYQPVMSDVIELGEGREVERNLELTGVRVLLDTIRVVDRSVCRIARDSAAATFAVWEQVRAALTATQVSASGGIAATIVGYERALDRGLRRVRAQRSFVRSGFVRQPWLTRPPDSLHAKGYVTTGSDDSLTYYAPGLDALLSPQFVEDHCFRLTRSKDAALLGTAFEPTRDRKNIPEIKGTLWLDKASSELRRLDYTYVNLSGNEGRYAGGEMEFIRMKNGAWAISRWAIRMPVIARTREPIVTIRAGGRGATVRTSVGVIGVHVAGGELALAVLGQDTLWSRPPLRVSGIVTDSVTGERIAGARVTLEGTTFEDVSDASGRFMITDVLPGEYVLLARSPSLDSLGAVIQSELEITDSTTTVNVRLPKAKELAATLCKDPNLAGVLSREGVIVGRVEIRGDTAAPQDVRVVAQWAGRGMVLKHEVLANDRGAYRMCGVPLDNTIYLKAVTKDGLGSVSTVLIPGMQRFARADLVVDRTTPGKALFSGLVLVDSTKAPIAEAEVALPALKMSALTNEKGEFEIADVPPGTHDVSVRRIGYGPMNASLSFAPAEAVSRTIFLAKFVVLDTVSVTASAILPDFEDNRRLGLGQFLTRAELAKLEGQTMGGIFIQMRGAAVITDPMFPTRKYLTSSRPRSLTRTCYAVVYLDKTLVFANKEEDTQWDLFDLNSISPDRIEAIEYYATPAVTPVQYSTLNSQCGVLVIHTRRSP